LNPDAFTGASQRFRCSATIAPVAAGPAWLGTSPYPRIFSWMPGSASACPTAFVGASQVMLGTDWPHQVHDARGALGKIDTLGADQREAVRGGNALRVFGL
jgi:predicted TIM-barrel fold metal-dependent hydrolase